MVPAARRFSTPNPLSFPMMSRRTYLGERQSWDGMGRTGGSVPLRGGTSRKPGQDVEAALAEMWGRVWGCPTGQQGSPGLAPFLHMLAVH